MDILLAGLGAIIKGFMGLNEGKTLPYLMLIAVGFLTVGLFFWFLAAGIGILE
jgi:hypothetical protein